MAGPITVTFDVPDLDNDPATDIESKCAQLFQDLNTWKPQANSIATAFTFNSTNSTSAGSETIGTGAKQLPVDTSKSYVKGMWITAAYTTDPTEWMSGVVTSYDSGTGVLDFSAIETSGHSTTRSAWTVSQARPNDGQKFYRAARTSNSALTNNDYGKFIDITSGTFTQTFNACSTLTDGWWVRIRNGGTGDITLDPNSTETIDGRTTFIMYPGEVRDIFCDGSNLYSVVVNPFFRRITSTYSNMPIPPGYTRFGIRAWSGGASGQRTNNASALSRGGAGGGCIDAILPASSFSSTETVSIGAGGDAVTTVANGNVGGDTTFGSLLTVYAGGSYFVGGSAISGWSDSGTNQEAAFAGDAGAAVTARKTGYGGASTSANASTDSGSSIYGGGAGGSINTAAVVRAPGTSVFGGNGGAASSASNGTAGSQPGGGGGATQTGTQSGAGGDGQVDFWGIV